MQNKAQESPALFWHWLSIIPKEICEHIINSANWESKKEGIFGSENGYKQDHYIRKTEVVFNAPLSIAECILRSYITVANKSAGWNYSLTEVQPVQIGRYVDGGHYAYHKDAELPNNQKISRKLSAVLFLSDPKDYEGGVFEFEDLEGQIDKMSQGSIIVFPSYVKHRVTPVTSGERYTAVCWALGPAFK
jgi:PKHD-type hydroxylase